MCVSVDGSWYCNVLLLGTVVCVYMRHIGLKVHMRENFSLAFFALSEPTWVCDLGSGEKNRIFYQMTPDLESLWFFAAY